jgi:hypothetical protein
MISRRRAKISTKKQKLVAAADSTLRGTKGSIEYSIGNIPTQIDRLVIETIEANSPC